MSAAPLTAADKRAIWARMRVPVFAFVALMLLASFIEAGLTLCMIGTVLLFSMEVRHEDRRHRGTRASRSTFSTASV